MTTTMTADAKQIDDLIEQLGSEEYPVPIKAEAQLIKIGRPAVNKLIQATQHPIAQIRWRAAYALSQIRDIRAYPAILRMVQEYDQPDSEERYEAILALGRLKDPRAIEPLKQIILTSENYEPQIQWASVALADIGQKAVPVFKMILRKGNKNAQEQARIGLKTIRVWKKCRKSSLKHYRPRHRKTCRSIFI